MVWIFIWDTAPSKIFVWWSEVASVRAGDTKVRPTKPPTKTFTITWTEKSNMSSWWTYSDDATWLTAGSTAFDEFFWYSAVKLASNGTESAEVSQSSPWTLDITWLWTLTSGDNVMIKFPVRWIKMSKSWSTVTLSITDELWKSWYQYYAFQNTWDIQSNTESTTTKPLYLWAYLSYNNSNVLKSWSWKVPVLWSGIRNDNLLTYSKANGTWWSICWWYQRQLINAYYMMKYWNPNCRTTVGYWLQNSWLSPITSTTTWATNSQTAATYWATNLSTQIKLFWLENWRWWASELLWWAFMDGSKNLRVALHDFENTTSTSNTKYKNAWTFNWPSSWNYNTLAEILWTNKWMFWQARSRDTSSSYSTYYCARTQRNIGGWLISVWYANDWSTPISNALDITMFWIWTTGWTSVCARLMYL
jgi:hypothetical protein